MHRSLIGQIWPSAPLTYAIGRITLEDRLAPVLRIVTMSTLQDQWRRASRGTLYHTPTFNSAGLVLGYETVLVRRWGEGYALANDADRLLCLLSVLRRRPESPKSLQAFDRALASWTDGDKALAHLHLAFAKLPIVDTVDDAWRLHQAGVLIDLGMAPRALAKELGLEPAGPSLSKRYDQDEPRNPPGSGRAGGEWTKDPVAAGSIAFAPAKQPATAPTGASDPGSAEALLPSVPSLVDTLGTEALEWLNTLVGRLALPAAVLGAIFVPSPSAGTSQQGAVPGRSGMSYRLDRDSGTLRLSLDSDPDPDHALVALLGTDGIYRDVETKVPIARAVGSEAVLIDLDRAPAIAQTTVEEEETDEKPKLCPDPSQDQGGGRKLFDIIYEQWVRDNVNPQRKPQLPPGIAFALPADTKTGWVHYDDCQEATGGMVEAKGNYAGMLRSEFTKGLLKDDWLNQADR